MMAPILQKNSDRNQEKIAGEVGGRSEVAAQHGTYADLGHAIARGRYEA